MAITTAQGTEIIAGIDTHQDLHTAAIVNLDGTVLGTESFSTTRAGYRAMLRWFRAHGEVLRVGVESTGSYGAGITRHLALAACPCSRSPVRTGRVGEPRAKTTPWTRSRRPRPLGPKRRVQVAKDRSGAVEALRVLRTTRKTAIKCRRAALQQLHNTIVAAPEEVRDQVRNLTRMQRLRTCGAWRPDTVGFRDPVVATRLALKSLARRILDLNDEIADLDRFIVPLVEELAPASPRARRRGRHQRRRADGRRGGESGPAALRGQLRDDVWRLPDPRLERENPTPPAQPRREPPSQLRPAHGRRVPDAYRRTNPRLRRPADPGRASKREVMRCLKRYVAREIYRVLTAPSTADAKK